MTETLEGWAEAYLVSSSLAHKLAPPPLPSRSAPGIARRLGPGRPRELTLEARARKAPRPGALRDPARRAELLHTFFHHELQAAELMCWAVLAFPDTPETFRRGLAGIALDEVRHMGLYRQQIERLGAALGDYPVRDWFWERVPSVTSPASFVALLGVGFEGGNLDHSARWSELLRSAGDAESADVEAQVGREEIAHVRFALRWLAHFAGDTDYTTWRALIPAPMTPLVLRGKTLEREARTRAGMSDAFLDALERDTDPHIRPTGIER